MLGQSPDPVLTYGGFIALVGLFLALGGVVAGMATRLADIRERLARIETQMQEHNRHHVQEEGR